MVMTYADSGSCSRGPVTFAVTTDQATSNSCSAGATGVVDMKLYGGGATPLFLTVTSMHESKKHGCVAPDTPVQWVAIPLSVDMCVPSVGCRYAGALYTRTVCSSTHTYQDDVAVAFGVGSSRVTVERYIAGKACVQSALSSVVTYVADRSCHSSSPTTSFRAIQNIGGSSEVELHVNSTNCDSATPTTIVATFDQINSNACVFGTGFTDVKVHSSYA